MVKFSCVVSPYNELHVAAEPDSDSELEICVTHAVGYDNRVYLSLHQVEELANHLLKVIGQDNG